MLHHFGPPPPSPATAAVRASLTPALFLRHLALLLLFNSAIAVVLAWPTGKPLAEQMAYAQAIGLSIWLFIDVGRLFLRPDPRTGWPHGRRGVALVAFGIVAGYALGTTLGDAYAGRSTWSLWQADPRRLAGYVAVGLVFGTLGSLFFYGRGRLDFHRAQQAALERDATLARLALLQSQLEPHMLFNTLANLRVLIELDPPRAQAMLDRLIAFLRATLTGSRAQAHPLSAEFERLADYLALMGMRMGERLSVRLALPDELRALPVPPLLLQPLVENAIRHGLEPQVGAGRLEVRAQREGEALLLSVRDTGVGLDGATPATAGTGFGLQQVRERLHTLFGERAGLKVQPAADDEGGTLALIHLPWPQAAVSENNHNGRTGHG
jgi:hypothetical protein